MPMNIRRAQDESSRWVTFELAGQLYGLEILKVQEVLADTEIESVPGAAAQILGVANLRGAIVTILDLRMRLGLTPRPVETPICCVVVDGHGESVGLRVDRVVDVRRIGEGAIKRAPATGSSPSTSGVMGVVSRPGELLTLLDADVLVSVLSPALNLAHAA